jgi:hypothetical protein
MLAKAGGRPDLSRILILLVVLPDVRSRQPPMHGQAASPVLFRSEEQETN